MAGYGLRPVKKPGADYNTGGFVELPIRASIVTAGTVSFFNGDTVKYTLGASPAYGVEIMESPDTTNKSIGVVVGARWTDTSGTPQWGQYYPAGSAKTGTTVYLNIAAAQGNVFMIQGSNAWDDDQIGTFTAVANGAGGSTGTGNSSKVATNNNTSTGTFALQIVSVIKDGLNEDSATPDVLVRFNPAAISAVELG
jgi:hypothetical protein